MLDEVIQMDEEDEVDGEFVEDDELWLDQIEVLSPQDTWFNDLD
tara:strand:+ start:2817 stop:2948 length:132 start_codon:yes stop_codon:yes gene_type:complete